MVESYRSILLTDKNADSRKELAHGLESEGFRVAQSDNWEETFELHLKQKPDMTVIDPRGLGISLKRLGTLKTPYIVYSALESEDVNEQGKIAAGIIDGGADFYLAKPSSPSTTEPLVVASYIDAALRSRKPKKDPNRTVWEGIEVINNTVLIYGNKAQVLPRTESVLFKYLLENKGRVLTDERLLDHLYDGMRGYDSTTLNVWVSRLRRLIKGLNGKDMIRNYHGIGYELIDSEIDELREKMRREGAVFSDMQDFEESEVIGIAK